MKRIVLSICAIIFLAMSGMSNNVRIVGDVRVVADDVNQANNIATVKFTVKWDNSWRDAFNYDGVYLFFKYKVEGKGEQWHHAYLMEEENHVVNTSGYDIYMHNTSGTANCCEGMFIHRSLKGKGHSAIELELKWLITSNSDKKLVHDDFVTGSVSLSAMCVELVYLPRIAFRAGDSKSNMTFKNNHLTIPSDKDILTEQKYVYTSSAQTSSSEKTENPPEFAVNRINDQGTTPTNAWVGGITGEIQDWWSVEFNEAKTIRNIAIESIKDFTPLTWKLQGKNGDATWTTLYEGTGEDWTIGSQRTYPCTRAIKVENTGSAYKWIRILITGVDAGKSVAIKNVAMTTEDLFESIDNSVLIFEDTTLMDKRIGLFAHDGDPEWIGYTPSTYPNGYSAFWAMKYELSQEQYVAFLNKLSVEQQKTRTLASAFENIKEGEYIFGSNRNISSSRNGIKLASKGLGGESHLFVNDLDTRNDYAQDGDGQTLACNFLNAGDMMAYADWCGLRPLSELEYEKMARRPYPDNAIRGEYAWNTDIARVSTALREKDEGSKAETAIDGNVNAKNNIGGPIRCGAYATESVIQADAGSSFWGIMELSGNVAEICYNANKEGRIFKANQKKHHGDGKLASSGHSNVDASFWPNSEKAFALRGGNFKSELDQLTISDRSSHWDVYTAPSQVYQKRDDTTGFRLGATAPVLSIKSEVKLQNKVTSANELPFDTICSGGDYTITGVVPPEITGTYQIAWFMSEDKGAFWDIIPGQEEPSLQLNNLRNINEEQDFFKEYQFRRKIYSSGAAVEQSNTVSVWVINHDIRISSYRDTVDISNVSNGITVTAHQEADMKWYWVRPNSGNKLLEVENELIPNISYQNFFKRSDFYDGTQVAGVDVDVLIETRVMETCTRRDTVKVYVARATDVE